jgi:hypothetical protein
MMSKELETARQQAAEGNYKRAVGTLWVVEAKARFDLDEARGLLHLASSIRDATEGRVQKDCDLLIEYAQTAIDRGERAASDPIYGGAIAFVPRCRMLGGHGFSARVGEVWDLVFAEEALKLRNVGSGEVVEIDYPELTAIEIGGPGGTRSGGGFFGGGFGLAGAAEGMLIATALNMLTTRTSIDTVICLQTQSAELFFHHGETAPDALRIRLSPVFSRLRQQQARGTSPPIDLAGQLAQLAELHRAGALTDRGAWSGQAEAAGLKATCPRPSMPVSYRYGIGLRLNRRVVLD